MMFKVKKLHPDVRLPAYSKPMDAAFDVYSCEDVVLKPGERHQFKLGFSAEFDEGYVCHVWDRSGLAKKGLTTLGGVIDAGYRGEYGVVLYNASGEPVDIKKGDRIAQMVIQRVEHVEIQEAEALSDTERGTGGWGSTGK
ncbi:MAG: dUTP diphosphatase [Patescibacteria group bacterium]|jgi:dUTP pyrophosphatase